MATSPLLDLGGVVTVPDPVTGGAGAPVIVSEIINTNWANGFEMLNAAFELGANAADLAVDPPQIDGVALDKSYLPPTVPTNLPNIDPAEGIAMYQSSLTQINTLIQSGYTDFLTTHFQDGPVYRKAIDWITNALTNGGSVINPAVEQALWERDRARITAESQRLENETASMWANRGFALPPNALAGQVADIRLATARQLGEQSRTIAIKSWEAELENVRRAVQMALDLRSKALQAAADYIRTLILGPQTAVRLATGLAGLKTELLRSLTSLYTAQVAALEPTVRLAITDAQLKQAVAEANLNSKLKTIDQRVQAAEANARMVGTAAAAILNGVNARSEISGMDKSSL